MGSRKTINQIFKLLITKEREPMKVYEDLLNIILNESLINESKNEISYCYEINEILYFKNIYSNLVMLQNEKTNILEEIYMDLKRLYPNDFKLFFMNQKYKNSLYQNNKKFIKKSNLILDEKCEGLSNILAFKNSLSEEQKLLMNYYGITESKVCLKISLINLLWNKMQGEIYQINLSKNEFEEAYSIKYFNGKYQLIKIPYSEIEYWNNFGNEYLLNLIIDNNINDIFKNSSHIKQSV